MENFDQRLLILRTRFMNNKAMLFSGLSWANNGKMAEMNLQTGFWSNIFYACKVKCG